MTSETIIDQSVNCASRRLQINQVMIPIASNPINGLNPSPRSTNEGKRRAVIGTASTASNPTTANQTTMAIGGKLVTVEDQPGSGLIARSETGAPSLSVGSGGSRSGICGCAAARANRS